MKKINLLFIHLLITVGSFSQSYTYDSSFRFYYYDQKLSMFEIMPDTKNEIIWLGDSITDGGEWSELFPKHHTLNRGISSDNTFGILNRLYEVIKRKPKKIFLLIGINDISRNIPDSIIIRNYRKIMDSITLQSPNTILYIQSILPTNNNFIQFKNHQNKTEHIIAINTVLQKMCSTKKCIYIDLYTPFLNTANQLNEKYTNDGLHLTGAGYQYWKLILQKNNCL